MNERIILEKNVISLKIKKRNNYYTKIKIKVKCVVIEDSAINDPPTILKKRTKKF